MKKETASTKKLAESEEPKETIGKAGFDVRVSEINKSEYGPQADMLQSITSGLKSGSEVEPKNIREMYLHKSDYAGERDSKLEDKEMHHAASANVLQTNLSSAFTQNLKNSNVDVINSKKHMSKLSDSELKFIEQEDAETYQHLISADDKLKQEQFKSEISYKGLQPKMIELLSDVRATQPLQGMFFSHKDSKKSLDRTPERKPTNPAIQGFQIKGMNKSPSFPSQSSNSTKKLNKMEGRDSPVTKDEFASNRDFLMKIGFTNVPKAEAEANQPEISPIKKPFKNPTKDSKWNSHAESSELDRIKTYQINDYLFSDVNSKEQMSPINQYLSKEFNAIKYKNGQTNIQTRVETIQETEQSAVNLKPRFAVKASHDRSLTHIVDSSQRINKTDFSDQKREWQNNIQREKDELIDEIRGNYFQKVQNVIGGFIQSKRTANTIQDTSEQMRSKIIKNSYQMGRKQDKQLSPSILMRQAGGQAIRTKRPPGLEPFSNDTMPTYTGKYVNPSDIIEKQNWSEVFQKPIEPIEPVRVPKDLLILKIAQKQAELAKRANRQQMYRSVDRETELRTQSPKLFLPTLPGSITARNQSQVRANQRSSVSTQGQQDFVDSQNKGQITDRSRLNQDMMGGSLFRSNILNQSIGPTLPSTEGIPSTNIGQSISFHITDLLEKSINQPREMNTMKATIEYYKRSIKPTDILNQQKEIIIKNYRLRVVDAKVDLTERDRRIMKLNKGTAIYVSNSLVKPEIYRYSTKVSDAIVEVFAEMRGPEWGQDKILLSADNFDSLTYQDQIELETQLAEKYYNKDDLQEMQRLQGLENESAGAEHMELVENGDIKSAEDQRESHTAFNQNRKGSQHISIRDGKHNRKDLNETQQVLRDHSTPDQQYLARNKSLENNIKVLGNVRNSAGQTTRNYTQTALVSYDGKSKTTALTYDQDELRAVQLAEYLFDKWVRNLQTAQTAPLQEPQRQINSYGEKIQPSIDEIKFRILKNEGKDRVLKPKEFPIEKLTAITIIADKPYLHLLRTITVPEIRSFHKHFLKQTIQFRDRAYKNMPTHMSPVIQNMTQTMVQTAIKFTREQLTHLDPPIIQDYNMHPELFIEYEIVQELLDKVNEYKLRLADGDELNPPQMIFGYIDYFFPDGKKRNIRVQVFDFEKVSERFSCYSQEYNVCTMRSRIYILLETDNINEQQKYMKQVIHLRTEAQQYLRLTRLIQNECLQRYDQIYLPETVRQNIFKFVNLDMNRSSKKTVHKAILQVEALYVFSILKSMVSSQRDDPFIKNMMLNFKVASDSPALEIHKQPCKEKKDLQGIRAFKIQAIRTELSKNATTMMNPKYIELPKRNYALTMSAIGDNKIFNTPIDVKTLVITGGKAYSSGMSIMEMDDEVNKYPLDHDDWVKAQKVVAKHFHTLIKTKWASQLAKSVWQAVEDDFDFNADKQITEEEIDPFLVKLFSQIKQFQQTLLFTLFERGLRDYIRFLIGFAIRNEDIRKSAIFRNFATTNDIKLCSEDPNVSIEEGQETNDLNMIPRHGSPMINLKAILADVQGKSRFKKKKIITEPNLEDIQKEMMSIVRAMHDATKEVKRVETAVFPNLTLKQPYLMQPDIGQNPRLKNVLKMINKLLEQCTKGVKSSIANFQQYIAIFDKKTDTIKGELQKASFALANEGEKSDKDGEKTPETHQDDAAPLADFDKEKEVKQEESEVEASDNSDDDEGGAVNNNNAFKSEPINPGLMQLEIEAVRNHKWNTIFNVNDRYDFGLLVIDCSPFKQEIIDHCIKLELYLEDVVRQEFLEMMKRIQDEIQTVKGRLDEKAESIDEVLSLLDYIDNLKGSDNKVGDIKIEIDKMALQMNFILELKIQFEDKIFQEFLNIRNWPRTFNKWIQIRKEELLAQKQKLIEEMNEQLDEVWKQVLEFKLEIKDVKSKGLTKILVKERDQRVLMISTMFDKLRNVPPPKSKGGESTPGKADEAKDKKTTEKIEIPDLNMIPENATFEWLAQEIGVHKHRFDSYLIDQTFQRTEKMKDEYERVQRLTILINKRQQLLGVEKTQFSELKKIQDDLKPIYELWAVASRFNTFFPIWMEGVFEQIEAADVENTLEEWLIELKKLQKTALITNDKKGQQKGLLMFMYDVIIYFKQYMAMIKTLRTKGLSLRHWRQVGTQLGFSIDPQTITLFKIIALDLFKEEKLRVIKNISDIAQKEYAVSQALETLDREIKSVEFEFETAPDNITWLCRGIPDVNSRYEEFFLRVNVLKTNPHMKNFFDKLIEIEKIVKSVIEILFEWAIFQRNWLYLNGIFAKSEISKQLANEVKQFQNLDMMFKMIIKSIVAAPQVYKISQRENFLNILKKMNQDSDTVRAGLSVFMDNKRDSFPRLFFISNEELIDLFGRADQVIEQLIQGKPQAFLHQLYEGIEQLKVDSSSKRLTGMVSKQGEVVVFKQNCETAGSSPERWLKDLESMMCLTIKHQIFNCYENMDADQPKVPEEIKEYGKFMSTRLSHERQVDPQILASWVRDWPAQCVYTCMQIWFTQKAESIFESAEQRRIIVKEERRKLKIKLGSEYEHSDSDVYASIQYSDDDDNQNDNDSNKDGENEKKEDEEEEEEDEDVEEGDEQQREEEATRKKQEEKKSQEEIVERILVSNLDRLMRFRDRFLINTTKHPNYQFQDMTKTVIQKTQILSQMLRGKLTVFTRASIVGLITVLVYQRDLSQSMKKQQIYKSTDFEWQMALKMKIMGLDIATNRLTGGVKFDSDMNSPPIQARKDTQKIEVVFDVLSNKKDYGFEYLGCCARLVVTPLTERCQRALLIAMQYNYGGAPEGPFGTGKTETTKDLARTLAKLCFIQNVSTSIEYESILRFFKGVSSSGSWVIFDEFNRMEPKILSFLSQIIINIQNAIRKKVAFVHLDENKLNLNFNCAIFVTLNPGYAGRTELPMDLKNLFRSISMVVPDAFFITEILLFSAGFKNAQALAKRLCDVQKLANILMSQSSVVRLDFGLRAIKAIIAIAETLKQQVQNIWESELPDLIADESLEVLPLRAPQMIIDVQNELEPVFDFNSPTLGLSTQNISPNQPMDESFTINARATGQTQLGQTKSSNMKDPKLNTQQIVTKRSKMMSNFFKKVFGGLTQKGQDDRQSETVMAQIGLEYIPDIDEIDLEEFIIIKALRDFNCSKFSRDQLINIDGIINDVFQGSVPAINFKQSEYSALGELVRASFDTNKLDYSPRVETKAFQLYEITQVKQGCIILGDVMSGKTTLINLLAAALNRASQNELKLRMCEKRREKLLDIAVKQAAQALEEENNQKLKGRRKGDTGVVGATKDSFISADKPQAKKGKPKNEAKSKMVLWQEMFKKSKLTKEVIDELRDELIVRGVETARINPKSVNISQLFGEVNKETYVWTEGVFTQQFREFSKDKTSKKKWILLDGPIDYIWVENLNSVLDDNQKLNLPTGETISLSNGMCLILETDNLRNVTPATISRCGLVFMNRQEVNKSKQMFNQYLMQCPPNVSEILKDMETQANWLFVDALKVFEHERSRKNLLLNDVDEHWIVRNFIQMLDSFLQGYWIEFINNNLLESEDGGQQIQLAKTAWAYGADSKDILKENEEDNIDPGYIKDYFENMRLVSQIKLNQVGIKNEELRLAHNDFNNKTNRTENALKYLPKWSESFVILSITWTFALVLKKPACEYLGKLLQKRIEQCQSDFSTYQKIKKKQQQQKEDSARLAAKEAASSMDTKSNDLSNPSLSPNKSAAKRQTSMNTVSDVARKIPTKQYSQKLQHEKPDEPDYELNTTYTREWSDKEKPLFISEYPFEQGNSIFDCYFNMENSSWVKFDMAKVTSRMLLSFGEQIPSMRLIQNIYVPTMETVKVAYVMESLLTTLKPVAICGDGACGKTSMIKDFVFNQIFLFTQGTYSDHITCSHYTNSDVLKSNIERNLEPILVKLPEPLEPDVNNPKAIATASSLKPKIEETNLMKTPGEQTRLIVYLEDLHMTWIDQTGDQPALETIRDFLVCKEWYSPNKKAIRKIQGANIVTCFDALAERKEHISKRTLSKFFVVGLNQYDIETSRGIFTQLFEIAAQEWPSSVTSTIPKLAKAIMKLYETCFEHLKPTPIKVQYTFNHRECFKMVTAICKIESSFLKSEVNLMKLFYHEAMRQYADKILMKHDLDWFMATLQQVCMETFDMNDKINVKTEGTDDENNIASDPVSKVTSQHLSPSQSQLVFPIKDPNLLWFSIMNDEAEGYYFQIELDKTESLIESWLDKYNESQERQRISLIQHRELSKHLLKALRAINMHDGHLIIVGLKGYGIQIITKLACFISNIHYVKMEMNQNYLDEDWRQDLRKNIVYCVSEDKPLAYVCDEFRITNDKWYLDLECLVKSNVCSEITRKNELMTCLVQIQQSKKRALKALQGMSKEQAKKNETQVFVDHTVLNENKKLIEENAQEKADLYYSFLKKVKKNFHLIFNFTPSGKNFREKMEQHKQLMICSQMIWIQNLQEADLTSIGSIIFVQKIQKDLQEKSKQQPESDKLGKKGEGETSNYEIQKELVMNQKILKAVTGIYLQTQKFAKKYEDDSGGHVLTFTPVFFLRTFKTYSRLLEERRRNVVQIQTRYDEGLRKIKKTQEVITRNHGELAQKSPVLQEQQRKLVAIVVDIEEEIQKVKIQKESLQKHEIEGIRSVEIAIQNKNECQDQLDKIVPLINEAVSSMQQISKYDVAEIRTLQHPPKAIKLVLKAVCILLEVEPIVKQNKKNQWKPSYWRAATSEKVLGDPNLPQVLVTFDRNKLTTETMGLIEDILSEADYTYENANFASKAATGLFRWVKAIRDYYYIFQEMQPRRDALMEAEKVHIDLKDKLRDKQREIKAVDEHLEGLRIHQETKQKLIDELKSQIEDTITRKKRSEQLMKSLNQELQKWIVCSRMLSTKYDTVQGDVVLSAAYITMGSGFTAKFRKQLIFRWQNCLKKAEIGYNSNFEFQEMFGDNFKIREWYSNDLPPDHYSTDNALIMQKSKRFVYFIDPDSLAQNWIRKQYKNANIRFTKMTDINFKRTLEIGIDLGQIIVIEGMNDIWCVELESLIKKEISTFGNNKMIKFCRRQLKYDGNFNLYLATNNAKPRIDTNISNHIQQINFFVSVEGLTQNILSIVVANERPDLEQSFNENTKDTFDNIKILKDTEEKILQNLGVDEDRILSSNTLIDCLKNSKASAEIVAQNLKKIQQTNQFLQKSRNRYAGVALRAANLFFALKNLRNVNPMYRYSLTWFMNIFMASITKANLPTKSQIVVDDEEYAMLNNKFSPQERINMLNQIFTQELIRKVIFSVYQDDRQLVTYYIAINVLSAEGMLDPEMLAFSLAGSKRLDMKLENPNVLPWMTNLMFSELTALQEIAPFNQSNLMNHIIENPALWDKLYKSNNIAFTELPNRSLIDFGSFLKDDLVLPKTASIALTKTPQQSQQATGISLAKLKNEKILLNTASGSKLGSIEDLDLIKENEAVNSIQDLNSRQLTAQSKMTEHSGRTKHGDESRASSNRGREEDINKIWTEEELLADEDLWRVTDSEGSESDEQSSKKKSLKVSSKTKSKVSQLKVQNPSEIGSNTSKKVEDTIKYDPSERNKMYYEDSEMMEDEEEQMAKYLIEQAPSYDEGRGNKDNYGDMQRMTKHEKQQLQIREKMLRYQVELCLIRCLRPDLIKKCFHSIVEQVYDFNYNSFEQDVLSKFIDSDATNQMRRIKQQGQMPDNKNPKKSSGRPKKVENNVQLLIKEAYKESKPTMPIFFLVTHSVNVFNELHSFHQRNNPSASTKLIQIQVGRGLDKKVEDALSKAQTAGDWLLIENLHLTGEWLYELEIIIQKFPYEKKLNPKFRLWLSSVQMDNCPAQILRMSVKVALQQPTGIKLKMERLVEKMESENWRKMFHRRFYKNLFISLCYLHSVLDGRGEYGTLGWNIYSGFDSSDFEISAEQIKSLLPDDLKEKDLVLYVIKYLFANINYSGKISRKEDQRKLDAHIEDLFKPSIAYSEELPADPSSSHYGFPHIEESDLNEWVKRLPAADSVQIFGFNQNIERYQMSNKAFDLMRKLYNLQKTKILKQTVGYNNLEQNIENISVRISLAKSSMQTLTPDVSHILLLDNSNKQLTQQASGFFDPEAAEFSSIEGLLPQFVNLQKLLTKSSLDANITEDCDRFDERVDSDLLPQRDEFDKQVAKLASKILKILKNLFSENFIDIKLPPGDLKKPIHVVYNTEIKSLLHLINVIIKSVEDLLAHVNGVYQKPIEIEKLWQSIQQNQVPMAWRKAAFQTSCSMIADFLLEMAERIKFWQNLLNCNAQIPALWLPALYDPSQFMNALIQKIARSKKIPTSSIKNSFHVMDFYEPTFANCPPEENHAFIYGLYLEGASWDLDRKLLVEARTTAFFERFPVVRITTEELKKGESDDPISVFDELDNPKPSKQELKQIEEIQKMNEDIKKSEIESSLKSRSPSGQASSQLMLNGKEKSSGPLKNSSSNYNFKIGGDLNQQSDSKLSSQVESQKQLQPKETSNISNATLKAELTGQAIRKEAEELGQDDIFEDLGDDKKTYIYRCPLFRTTLRLSAGDISSDNKPVSYIDLPTKTHPKIWVKRSVALLMETSR